MSDDAAITACLIQAQSALTELIEVHNIEPFDALTSIVEWFNDGRTDPASASETLTVGRIIYG